MSLDLKHIIICSALLFSMATANASTISIGDLTSYGVDGYSALPSKGTGSFSDVYNFTVPSLSGVGAAVTNLSHGSLWNIQDLSLTLKNSSNVVLATGTFSDGSYSLSQTLAQGGYSFTVAGIGSGSFGGKYAINAIAAPVPEPSAWAMMLGGLGLVGFMAYRRRHEF
ncbi:MAG: FxDxF family PEP-CTERM protein [Pseudomonadota bacterium]